MALTVLDAGVMIGLLDGRDAHHKAAKETLGGCLEQGDRFVVPASAYAEILVRPFERGGRAPRVIDNFLESLPAEVEPISRGIARQAARLRATHPTLPLPDALVIATALDLKADLVLTTDKRWPSTRARVRVV
jgi:predicted nucleic acid-binding protein